MQSHSARKLSLLPSLKQETSLSKRAELRSPLCVANEQRGLGCKTAFHKQSRVIAPLARCDCVVVWGEAALSRGGLREAPLGISSSGSVVEWGECLPGDWETWLCL